MKFKALWSHFDLFGAWLLKLWILIIYFWLLILLVLALTW